MRKKISTITRLDPAYTASLKPDARPKTVNSAPQSEVVTVRSCSQPDISIIETAQEREKAGSELASQEIIVADITPNLISRPKRKIDIRVNALKRQEGALLACGVDPAHVVRAALRRTVRCWKLCPEFVPASTEPRARHQVWQARTSLAVDAERFAVLLRDNDPLDVCSKWALIRGQIEPCIWDEIDIILNDIAGVCTVSGSENSDVIDNAVDG